MAQPSAPPAYDDAIGGENKPTQLQGAPYSGSPPYPATSPVPSTGQYGTGYAEPYASHPNETSRFSPMAYQATPTYSGNEGFTTRGSFDDQSVRRLFIRKVYLTLFLQLLVTFGIVCIFTFIPAVKLTVRQNPAMYYVAYGIFLVLYITLACCEGVRRKSPLNIVLLILFTFALSYMVGTIASYYNTQAVVVTIGVTVAVCLAVTLFSMQTKFDFTKCAGLLFVLSLVLMLFGFITIFTYRYSWYIQVVYGALGALVFTLFLAFDTQLIMGGKRYEMDPEEYIYGALNLYIDIVYIFIFLLSLIGGSNN